MTNREALASRRLVLMSPNAPQSDELEAVLTAAVEGVPVNRLQAYPSPRDLPTAPRVRHRASGFSGRLERSRARRSIYSGKWLA